MLHAATVHRFGSGADGNQPWNRGVKAVRWALADHQLVDHHAFAERPSPGFGAGPEFLEFRIGKHSGEFGQEVIDQRVFEIGINRALQQVKFEARGQPDNGAAVGQLE